jgi:DNA helicase IV
MTVPSDPREQERNCRARALVAVEKEQEAWRKMNLSVAASSKDSLPLRKMQLNKVHELDGARDQPFFGAMERINDGQIESYHIGNTHVELGEHMILDYRAPEAQHYYLGHVGQDLAEKRVMRVTQRDVESVGIEGRSIAVNRRHYEPLDAPSPKDQTINKVRTLAPPLSERVSGTRATEETLSIREFILEGLEGARTPHLQSIAATIQRDQFQIISKPSGIPLGIEGGPGTGKTIVGLHRVSRVMFVGRQKSGGLLVDTEPRAVVIGPSQTFIDYVNQTLPSIGDRTVRYAAMETFLLERLSGAERRQVVVGVDDDAVQCRAKSSLEMTRLVRKLVARRVLIAPLFFRSSDKYVYRSIEEVAAVLRPALMAVVYGNGSLVDVRDRLRSYITELAVEAGSRFARESIAPPIVARETALWSRRRGRQGGPARPGADKAAVTRGQVPVVSADSTRGGRTALSSDSTRILNRFVPQIPVLRLFGELRNLPNAVSEEVERLVPELQVTDAELRLLLDAYGRRLGDDERLGAGAKAVQVSHPDLAILDAIAAALGQKRMTAGRKATYLTCDHVLIDEGQDVTAAEWDAIGRLVRDAQTVGSTDASMTVLADFNQRTNVNGVKNWDAVWVATGLKVKPAVMKMQESYRVPAPILASAKWALLPEELASVPVGVRDGSKPIIRVVKPSRWKFTIESWIEALSEGQLGIVTTEDLSTIKKSDRVVITSPQLVKGLEFDHVLVLEPAAWCDETVESRHLLYVALTRPTKTVTVVHHRALPFVS